MTADGRGFERFDDLNTEFARALLVDVSYSIELAREGAKIAARADRRGAAAA
jgi:hypothetical protein